jgi:hypothetical protein
MGCLRQSAFPEKISTDTRSAEGLRVLEPAHDQIAWVLPFRQVLDRRQIVSDDPHGLAFDFSLSFGPL